MFLFEDDQWMLPVESKEKEMDASSGDGDRAGMNWYCLAVTGN